MKERTRLPDRRRARRFPVTWKDAIGVERLFDVGFGLDAENVVREVFCIPLNAQTGEALKTGSDLKALVDDACIALSLALQLGARITDLAKAFGENRQEGAPVGPPASPLGAIARAGVQFEADIATGSIALEPHVEWPVKGQSVEGRA